MNKPVHYGYERDFITIQKFFMSMGIKIIDFQTSETLALQLKGENYDIRFFCTNMSNEMKMIMNETRILSS